MQVNHFYIVSIFNSSVETLEKAKYIVKIALTREEAKRYLIGEEILHFKGDQLISKTPIIVDKHGNISFGKTTKI